MRFSIITCTYNPNPAIFARILNSLVTLVQGRNDTELIIVDNQSDPPLSRNPGLKEILSAYKQINLIEEHRPGQTYARISGSKASRGEVLVFVDDDNLLASDYLEQLEFVLGEHPTVA